MSSPIEGDELALSAPADKLVEDTAYICPELLRGIIAACETPGRHDGYQMRFKRPFRRLSKAEQIRVLRLWKEMCSYRA